MRYHIKWTHNTGGNPYNPPVYNNHSHNINHCHQDLSHTLSLYSLAKGEVEECHNKDCK